MLLTGIPDAAFIQSIENMMNDQGITKRIIRRLIRYNLEYIRNDIWIPRCEETGKWAAENTNTSFTAMYFRSISESETLKDTDITNMVKKNELYHYYNGNLATLATFDRMDRIAALGKYIF